MPLVQRGKRTRTRERAQSLRPGGSPLSPQGVRRTRVEADAVRTAVARGQEVTFATRRQWRHYHAKRSQ